MSRRLRAHFGSAGASPSRRSYLDKDITNTGFISLSDFTASRRFDFRRTNHRWIQIAFGVMIPVTTEPNREPDFKADRNEEYYEAIFQREVQSWRRGQLAT